MALVAAAGTGSPNAQVWTRNQLTSVVLDGVRYQVCIYYDPNRYVVVAKRTHPDGEWTSYTYDGTGGLATLRLPTTFDEFHYSPSIGLDRDGFVHMIWNGWRGDNAVAVQYRKSDVAIDTWAGALTAVLEFDGLVNNGTAQVQYGAFFNDPAGKLYYTQRDGSSDSARWVIQKYDETTEVWSSMGGSGSDGVIINAGGTSDSVYTQVQPQFSEDWDGAGAGRMWFVWVWRRSGSDDRSYEDVNAIYTDGVSWYKHTGAAQTIPATIANTTPAVDTSVPVQGRQANMPRDLAVSADGTKVMMCVPWQNSTGAAYAGAVSITNGTVAVTYSIPAFRRTFRQPGSELFRYIYGVNGEIFFVDQTTGFDLGTAESQGLLYGNGIAADAVRFDFYDAKLARETGDFNAMRFPTGSASVTPTVVEIAGFLNPVSQPTITNAEADASHVELTFSEECLGDATGITIKQGGSAVDGTWSRPTATTALFTPDSGMNGQISYDISSTDIKSTAYLVSLADVTGVVIGSAETEYTAPASSRQQGFGAGSRSGAGIRSVGGSV